MKTGLIFSIILIAIALGVLSWFIFIKFPAEQESGTNQIVETNDSANSVGETEIINDSEEQEEDFEIFNPILTYDGFYNGPLYGTSEQIGNYPIGKYMANLDRNGVNFFIGMFGILGKQEANSLMTDENLGYVVNAVEKYPHRIVPFFNPGYGGEEIEDDNLYGAELTELYSSVLSSSKSIAGENFIKGFGEIEVQEWNIRHNDPRILQLTDLASSNNINFMFHPVASKIDDVEKIIEKYPNTNFLIHMYREDLKNSKTKLIEIMKTHDNLFFSIDAAHILHYQGNDILYDYEDKYGKSAASNFINSVNGNYNNIMNSAVSEYKPLVEAVPDKIMWGTEAGPDYSFEPEVYDLMIKASRDFISRVAKSPEEQEAIGYKNALRAFGEGIVLEKDVTVFDSSSWPKCTETQIIECERDSCEITGYDLTPEEEQCFNSCLTQKNCIDPVEED